MILALSSELFALDSEKKLNIKAVDRHYLFLVKINNAQGSQTEKSWGESMCNFLSKAASEIANKSIVAVCEVTNTESYQKQRENAVKIIEKDIRKSNSRGLQYIYTLESKDAFVKKGPRSYSFTIENVGHQILDENSDEDDFLVKKFDLDDNSINSESINSEALVDSKTQEGLQKSKKLKLYLGKQIRNSISYAEYNGLIKQSLLITAIATDEYKNRYEVDASGMVIDKKIGTRLSMRTAYRQFRDEEKIKMSEDSNRKNYLRAGLDLTLVFGAGYSIYTASSSNEADWEYGWKDFFSVKRFREDDNSRMNNTGHSWAGYLYYMSARNNGFNAPASALVALGASWFWERVVEYREVDSINDHFFTEVSGSIIGEILYQVSEAVRCHQTGGSRTSKVIATVLNPIGGVNRWLDSKPHVNCYSNEFLKFEAVSGVGFLNSGKQGIKPAVRLGFEAELLKINDEPGKNSEWRADHPNSQVSLETTSTGLNIDEVHLLMKSVVAAYQKKNIELDEFKRLKGYSFLIGLSQGYEYQSRDQDKNKDWFATVNVLGATLDVMAYLHGVRVRFAIDIFADYAMIRNYALPRYLEEFSDPVQASKSLKSVMANRGYDYAMGYTDAAKLVFSDEQFELGVSGREHYYYNINGVERYTVDQNKGINTTDTIRSLKVWVSYIPKKLPSIKFAAIFEALFRNGTLFDKAGNELAFDSSVETRTLMTVSYIFK
jgi:hypothetical protein